MLTNVSMLTILTNVSMLKNSKKFNKYIDINTRQQMLINDNKC